MIEQKTARYPNLCAEIARCDETYTTVSELLDISISAVSRRMNGTVEWSKREIDLLCDHYGKDYDYLFKE